ncbi:MAG: hypothetical protein IT314_08755 [Anaerolineales bacterium]|nr:hypothetical protein [Anaerolineales bacterium]
MDIDVNGDGTPDYKGVIKESHEYTQEIVNPELAEMDRVTIDYETLKKFGVSDIGTEKGYLMGYDIVTVQNGSESVDLVFYRVKFFRKDSSPITIQFSTLREALERLGDFQGQNSLGKIVRVNCSLPNGADFTEYAINSAQKNMGYSDFEVELMFPDGAEWLRASEFVDILRRSEEDFVDLSFKIDASQMVDWYP